MRRPRFRTKGMTLGSCASGSVFLLPPSLSFSACESILCFSISFTRGFLTRPCYVLRLKNGLSFLAQIIKRYNLWWWGCCVWGDCCDDDIGNGGARVLLLQTYNPFYEQYISMFQSVPGITHPMRYTFDIYGWSIKVARRHDSPLSVRGRTTSAC